MSCYSELKNQKQKVLYSTKFLGLIMDEFLDWDEELILRLSETCFSMILHTF